MGNHASHLQECCQACARQNKVIAVGGLVIHVLDLAVQLGTAAVGYYRNRPQNDIILKEVPTNEEELERKAQQTNRIDSKNFYNFAFAGRTKTGKSSLINASRGLRDDEEGAAAVGITECTMEMSKPFECPAIGGTVRLYDVPGCGTAMFSAEGNKYYLELGLRRFDGLTIMAEQTLGEDEIKLARLCKKYSRPCIFVRSKCDMDLSNIVKQRKRRGESGGRQQVVEEKYKEEMSRRGIPEVPIFFVSCYSMYDIMFSVINTTEIPEDTIVYQEAQLITHLKEVVEQSRGQS